MFFLCSYPLVVHFLCIQLLFQNNTFLLWKCQSISERICSTLRCALNFFCHLWFLSDWSKNFPLLSFYLFHLFHKLFPWPWYSHHLRQLFLQNLNFLSRSKINLEDWLNEHLRVSMFFQTNFSFSFFALGPSLTLNRSIVEMRQILSGYFDIFSTLLWRYGHFQALLSLFSELYHEMDHQTWSFS